MENLHLFCFLILNFNLYILMSRPSDLNRQPMVYDTIALPIELGRQPGSNLLYQKFAVNKSPATAHLRLAITQKAP